MQPKIILNREILTTETIIDKIESENLSKEKYDGLKTMVIENKIIELKEFARTGNRITCLMYDSNGKVVAKGIAKCNTSYDDFDYSVGLQLAELRAKVNLYKTIEKEIIDKL